MSETDDRGNYFPGEAPGKRLPHPESHGHWDVEQISDLLYERDMYRRGAMRGGHLKLAADEIERLRAECEALRKDAERYRFIRKHAYIIRLFCVERHLSIVLPSPDYLPPASFDEEIDRFVQVTEGGPG